MQTIKNLLLIAVITLTVYSCKNENKAEIVTVETETTSEKAELDPNATYAKAEFTIEGMTCAIGCAKTIEKKLAKMEGVKSAKVDFDKKLAMVEYDNAKVTTTSLEETVTKASETYTVKEMKTVESFTAKAMSNTKKTCGADCKKDCCSGKDKKECSMKCSPDCTKKDCEKCAAKTAECKKKCDAKKAEATTDKKMACTADCKKACCVDKAKA